MNTTDVAKICKALGDQNRIEIVKMLADEEKCGCKLLERFDITQPTLSHHMKLLCDSDFVIGRKEGKWMYYSISPKGAAAFREMIEHYTRCDHESVKTEDRPCC